MAWENLGNPAGYQKSDLWDTDWGKEAYNANPYAKYTAEQNKWKNAYLGGNNQLSRFGNQVGGQMSKLGSQYGGIARWGARSAAPDDPILGGYMANIQGQQRNDIADATRAVASAGIVGSRGGYGVAGGPAIDSMLRQGGMNQIARGASDRYDKAMGYAKDLYGGIADTWGQGLNAQLGAYSKAADIGLGLGNQEFQGVQGGAQYKEGMFDRRRQDYDADRAAQQAWDAGTGARERERMSWEQQQRDAQQQRDRQQYLQQLLRQQYMGSPNTGYSPYEDDFARGEYLKQAGLIRGGFGKGAGSYNPSTLPGSRQIGTWDMSGYPL